MKRPRHAFWQAGLLILVLAGGHSVHASPWTEGQKRLLFIRVDFSDLPGAPFADVIGTNLVSSLDTFYAQMSYGRTSFALAGAGSDVTPTLRMPEPAAWYGTNNNYNQLRADARNAAALAGYTQTNYDLDITCMGSVPGWSWSGMSYVGAAGAWLRNSFNTGVAAHELGHNYGLNHANFWNTSGQSVIGPGTSVEQGDYWDTMGWALAGNNHFNAHSKYYLNWLRSNEVATVVSSGTYRISAHDDANASGVRALQIAKNSSTNYWVEFRQKFTGNSWLMNGALVHWAQTGNQKTLLLDTTPGSADGENDSALVIGRTFSDTQAGVFITPIGKGGTTPESLDVVVNIGAFPDNVAPTVTVAASATNAAAGTPLSFTATADDANGDALAYYWDFGDDTFGTNGPVATKSWGATGEYVVRCLVSDMKGGLGSASLIVQIGSPTTYRIGGSVFAGGSPVVNARVYVSSSKMAYTDSDGSYNLVGLAAGSYAVNASLYGYAFSPSGFSNPVAIGPNATNISFTAPWTNPPSIITQPSNIVAIVGQTATIAVTAASSTLAYQWKFNSTNLPSATNSVLTLNSVAMSSAGNYSVTVSNSAGGVASSNATLSVYPTAAATLSISAATNDRAVVSLSGVPGFNYALQSSTDLANWICLQTNHSPCTLMVTNDSPAGYQFFRALCLP